MKCDLNDLKSCSKSLNVIKHVKIDYYAKSVPSLLPPCLLSSVVRFFGLASFVLPGLPFCLRMSLVVCFDFCLSNFDFF